MGRKPAVDYRGLFKRFLKKNVASYTVKDLPKGKDPYDIVRNAREWAKRNDFPNIEIHLLRGSRTVVLKKKD